MMPHVQQIRKGGVCMSMIRLLAEIDARTLVGTACQVSLQLLSSWHKILLLLLQMLRPVRHLLSCMRWCSCADE